MGNCQFLYVILKNINHKIVGLGLNYFLDVTVCKFVISMYHVVQGTSLHSSSLLNCFHAISVNPSNSRWMKFKPSAAKYIVLSCSLSWLVHLIINSRIIMSSNALGSKINFTKKINVVSCLTCISGTNAAPL